MRQRGPSLQKRGKTNRQIRVSLRRLCCCKAAARLQSVHDAWDATRAQLDDALLYNRKLWSVFLSRDDQRRQSDAGERCARTSPISACS